MNLTIFASVPHSGSAPLSIDPRSLYHSLEQVKDGRKARGKRSPLALIFPLLLLGKLAGEWQQDHTWNKGHGRLEARRIWTTTLLNPLFERQWAGTAQVFVIRRRITHQLKWTQQIVYGITSLTPQQAEPKRLLERERTHWHIENRSHHRRDVTMGEEASQLRTSGAPLALAALNGSVLALMDWLPVSNLASQMRAFCARPQEALSLLLGALLR